MQRFVEVAPVSSFDVFVDLVTETKKKTFTPNPVWNSAGLPPKPESLKVRFWKRVFKIIIHYINQCFLLLISAGCMYIIVIPYVYADICTVDIDIYIGLYCCTPSRHKWPQTSTITCFVRDTVLPLPCSYWVFEEDKPVIEARDFLVSMIW